MLNCVTPLLTQKICRDDRAAARAFLLWLKCSAYAYHLDGIPADCRVAGGAPAFSQEVAAVLEDRVSECFHVLGYVETWNSYNPVDDVSEGGETCCWVMVPAQDPGAMTYGYDIVSSNGVLAHVYRAARSDETARLISAAPALNHALADSLDALKWMETEIGKQNPGSKVHAEVKQKLGNAERVLATIAAT